MKTRGFIALMSVLILSAVTLIIIIGAGLQGFYARMNELDDEFKSESELLAQSCIEIVRVRLITYPDYAGGDSVPMNGGVCDISAISNAESKHFTVSATQHHAATLFDVTIDPEDLSRISQKEIPSSAIE